HKELEPLRVAEVAASICMSQQRVEKCIQGTTTLISCCLGKGENIALVLKDIGVLLIEGTRVQMKFYYEFLEMLSGKENLEKAVFKVPQLRNMLVSRMKPLASLTFSGRVIIFPEFQMESVQKPAPQDHSKAQSKEKKKGEGGLMPHMEAKPPVLGG
ncbi:coiled-coil domain-containing protein 81-like, partial [Oxyura jamaicensis]|uniref:coiled-coil domain-containing protein 81-like n=1 Tax=Oxyura jamaicensis TaxID=8884 RepID=UPI0015A67A46